MNPSTNKLLAGVLVAQVGLTAFTWWPQEDGAAEAVDFVTFERDAITELQISGNDDQVVLKNLGDQGWVIPSVGDYPADPTKVASLLDAIDGMKGRRPVANQETSHKALKVGDDSFGRKVMVKAGDGEVTLLLGAAQSNSVNLRLDGETAVFEAKGIKEWDFKDTARSYYDAQYLDENALTVSSLSVHNAKGDFTVARAEDGGWKAEGSDVVLDATEVDGLVRKVTSLRMAEPVGKAAEPGFELGKPAWVEWTVTENDETNSFRLDVGREDTGKVYVKAHHKDFVVQVYTSSVDDVREKTLADLEAQLAE